jgi:hypothetical protein
MKFGENLSNADQVGEIFLAGKTLLALVGLFGEFVGFLEKIITGGIIGRGSAGRRGVNFFEKFLNTHEDT